MAEDVPADFAVDLDNCDREPIHVLGTVQPFGFLIALTADWLVSRASANCAGFIGQTLQDMLGRPISGIFCADAIHALRNRITLLRSPDAVERIFSLSLTDGGPPFDVAVHFSGPLVVVEGEPASHDEMEASSTVRSMVARLAQADGMAAFLRDGARQVRALTGFDRVMVYRFADNGDGEVVAEALRPGIDSFFGLHYPDSDIPAQARALYMRNIFRVIADINVGILYLFAISSLGVYGVIIAAWASNSKYAFLGALRASAQMVSYEIAMGFCFLVVIMVSGSMNLTEIVMGQGRGMAADKGLVFLSWNWLPLLPIFLVYLISGVAETNRHPFDVVEGEAEIVAGHMVEYSGMGFAIFFLAEYASMWLVSILAALMFLGGWLSPIDSALFNWIPGWIWLGLKTFVVVSMFIWIRATFPRFRYDQIMRLGWKIFIPVTLVWLLIVGGWLLSPWNIWK